MLTIMSITATILFGCQKGNGLDRSLLYVLKLKPMTLASEKALSHILDEQLCDLDGVRCRALTDLVAAAPQIEAALIGQILADAADEDDILIARVERHGVDEIVEIVNEPAAGGGGDDRLCLFDGYLLLCLEADRNAVAAHDGDADAGAADL